MAKLRIAAAVGTALGLVLTACSSNPGDGRPSQSRMGTSPSYEDTLSSSAPKPHFPVNPEPGATYCLVWVPPTYHEVPRLVTCSPDCVTTEKVFRRKVDFEEVCVPASYEKKCRPCTTTTEQEVMTTPGHTEWKKAQCCGPNGQDCYTAVECPPTYKMCEKTVTEKGVEYCAFKPPQYQVVEKISTVSCDRPVHVPGKYRVKWEQEEFECGHWEWRISKHCGGAAPPPPPKPACGCGSRGDFSGAPAKD